MSPPSVGGLWLVAAITLTSARLPDPPPVGHAFSVTSAATPRLIGAGNEIGVRLTIRNDGGETWRAERGFQLSYHWTTPRGRAAEYEGQRTPLPRPVAPGGSLTIEARLLAPSRPGVYLLQWDMVQEEVTWFSQRDPSPPARFLVVILPPLDARHAPIAASAVVAIALLLAGTVRPGKLSLRSGRGAIHRARSAASSRSLVLALLAVADVVWCVTSLFTKQIAVMAEAGLPLTAGALLVTLSAAALPAAALLLAFPRRRRGWAAWSVVAFGSLVVLADLSYLRYFGDVIAAPALLAWGQTGATLASVTSLLRVGDLWLFADVALAVLLILALARLPESMAQSRWSWRIATAACLIALVPGERAALAARGAEKEKLAQVFRNLSVVESFGLFGYHLYDAWTYAAYSLFRPPLGDAELSEVRAWFREQSPRRAGAGRWFGVARGKNVLVIQVESLQQFVLGYRINGQEVTPNLNRWLPLSLWFSSVADQTSEGRTSDAEFVTSASLLPLDHGAVAFRYPANRYAALSGVLTRHGYQTLSAVAFEPSFWNRRVAHKSYGFSRSLFASDFSPGERIGWGLNDRDFFRQMLPQIAALSRPFCAWLITLSLHHPFSEFPDRLKALDVGEWEHTPFGNYLHTMRFFDRAFEELVTGLARENLLDDTLIVVLGDHDAGFPWEGRLARALGFPERVLDWSLTDRVPLVVRVPGLDGPRGERQLVAGQIDLAPTLLALLGIDPAPLPYMGRNLLGDPGTGPVVRPYGDWVDDTHVFLSQNPSSGDSICYEIATRRAVPLAACQAGLTAANRQREISRRVLVYDLQQRLADRAR